MLMYVDVDVNVDAIAFVRAHFTCHVVRAHEGSDEQTEKNAESAQDFQEDPQ